MTRAEVSDTQTQGPEESSKQCDNRVLYSKVTRTDAVLAQFQDLNVWRRRGERAPHKPLLVLLALGRLQSTGTRMLPFDQIEGPLTRLLEEFGPPRKSPHPELPFYHLSTDGVWEIEDDIPLQIRRGSKNPLKSELRKFKIAGGFTQPVFEVLKNRPEAVRELARRILTAHFPESLHESIAAAVGLQMESRTRGERREAGFRDGVISAWGHQCAFCGYSVQLDHADLGLEAAHILWCQAGGPDTLNNGLACCSVHHQAFDRGAITVADDRTVLVSSRLFGNGRFQELFVALHGRPLSAPSVRNAMPEPAFLSWHRSQVFRGEPRD